MPLELINFDSYRAMRYMPSSTIKAIWVWRWSISDGKRETMIVFEGIWWKGWWLPYYYFPICVTIFLIDEMYVLAKERKPSKGRKNVTNGQEGSHPRYSKLLQRKFRAPNNPSKDW